MNKFLALITASLWVSGSYAATLEDWQFNDANGTALNSVTNTGTVGTSWNFGGPKVQAGSLNIGDATFYKWNPGSSTTTRTASFADITTGQHVFEFVVADWDLAGTDGLGVVNNGIKFNFGHTTNGSAQLEFEVAQAPGTDIRVRSQNSNNGNLSGTDAQNQLGGLNLTNTASVTVQLTVDLDTGNWSTKVDAGSDGSFVDLVTDGTGMTMIDRIQLIVDASNGTWEYGGVNGTATEFIKIDSVTLSEVVAAPIDPWTKLEYFTFDDVAGKSFNTFANTGSLGSVWNNGGPGSTVFTDGAGNLVVSNLNGQIFRKIPDAGTANADASNDEYAEPFTNGSYRLEMDLSEWALDPSASGNLTFAALTNKTGGIAAGIRLKRQDATTARLQLFHNDTNFRSFDFALTNLSGIAAAIEFDFDAGTATYYTNGVQTHAFSNFTNASQVATIRFNTDNNWSTNSVVKIGKMGFSQFNADTVPVLAVDFDSSQVSSSIQYEYFDLALNLAGSPQAALPNYSGQPIYAGLELDPVNGKTTGDDGGSYTNGAAISFGSNGGAKLQWNGPFPGSPGDDAGRYEEDDVATGVFLFQQGDFLNGLDSGTAFMDVTNDTLSATIRLDTKVTHPAYPLKRLKSGKFRWVVQDAGSFYISAEVTNLTSDTGNVKLTDEALELAWFNYDPETSITNITTAASPTLQDIDAIGFWMSATILTNDGNRTYPNMQCSSFEASATKTAATSPTGLYEEWIGGFSVGANAGLLDQGDSDVLDNLTEYAFGGDPSDGHDQGNTPGQSRHARVGRRRTVRAIPRRRRRGSSEARRREGARARRRPGRLGHEGRGARADRRHGLPARRDRRAARDGGDRRADDRHLLAARRGRPQPARLGR